MVVTRRRNTQKKTQNSSKSKKKDIPLLSHQLRWILFWCSCGLIVLFSFVIGYILFFTVSPVHVILMPYDFYINDTLGFDVGDDMVHFGQFLKSGKARRSFSIQNEFSSVVRLGAQGDYARHISFSDNDFMLLEGELKWVNASIEIPPGYEFGKYTGDIIVSFYKVD